MATAAKNRPHSQYARIWAAAKALGISSDELHDITQREYQKQSLKELTDRQVASLGTLLWDMVNGRAPAPGKRSDQGGRASTVKLRRKIYMIAQDLGWNEAAVNGFVFKQCGVSRQEWLTPAQCDSVIGAMQAMVKRKVKEQI